MNLSNNNSPSKKRDYFFFFIYSNLEVIELLPDELKQAKVMLPALGTTKLNKLIGLPSDKVKKNLSVERFLFLYTKPL